MPGVLVDHRPDAVSDAAAIELVHIYHSLCNPDRALCGVDLTGEEDYEAGPEDSPCVVCEELSLIDDCSVTCPLVVFE